MAANQDEERALLLQQGQGNAGNAGLREVSEVILTQNVDGKPLPEPVYRDEQHYDEQKARRSTILKPEIEDSVRQNKPEVAKAMDSGPGVMVQAGIVAVVLMLAVYENVFKGKMTAKAKATEAAKIEPFSKDSGAYNTGGASLFNAPVSIILGMILAGVNGTFNQIIDKEALGMLVDFIIPGVMFGISQFLNVFAVTLGMAPDVQKTLDQMRLLATAAFMWLFFKKQPSRSTWVIMIVISFAALMYAFVGSMVSKEWKRTHTVAFLGAAEASGAEKGAFLTFLPYIAQFLNVLVMSFAGVAAEKFLKKYKKTPFYIQKIFLEIPNLVIQIVILNVMPYVTKLLDPKKKISNVRLYKQVLGGWYIGFGGNAFFIGFVLLFSAKSYLQGILVKSLNSVVKQLTQTVATSLLYFFMLFHSCAEVDNHTPLNSQKALVDWRIGKDRWVPTKDGKGLEKVVIATKEMALKWAKETGALNSDTPSKMDSFICFDGVKNIRTPMVACNMLVFFAVVGYMMTNRDKTRKVMYRQRAEKAEEAGQAGAAGIV